VLPTALWVQRAESYLTSSIRWMVGFGAGTSVDIFARLIGQFLSERLGQPPPVIENRPRHCRSDLKSRIENLGYATFPMATAELTRFIADETEKWAKVIRAANIKAN
jgi:tripartite-type tricarboxylate transporter receptor subunit TctC